jgi:hypothetical protein
VIGGKSIWSGVPADQRPAAPSWFQPDLTEYNATDFRTMDGIRVLKAMRDSSSSRLLCVTFERAFPLQESGHAWRRKDWYVRADGTIPSAGSHIRLVYDPVSLPTVAPQAPAAASAPWALPKGFWLVWTSAPGYSTPRFQHTTEQGALTEAARLAKINPGKEFFALKTVARKFVPNTTPPVATITYA